MPTKKLYRSKTDRVFFGVVGGLGEYFDIDSTLLRLAWVLIVVFTGIFPGVLVYLLAALIVPIAPRAAHSPTHKEGPHSEDVDEFYTEYKKIV